MNKQDILWHYVLYRMVQSVSQLFSQSVSQFFSTFQCGLNPPP
jgi:hypothetical protein